MRILIITQYFPPEVEAGGFRMHNFGKRLVEKGHEVYILTGMPNFPRGIKPGEYKYKVFMREYKDGIHIFRSYVYPTENKGLAKRLMNYFSFVISSIVVSTAMPKVDVVIATSPPLFSGISGVVISRLLRRVPFIFEVRDIWPESAVVLGLITKPSVIGILERMEESFYKHAACIVVVTSGIAEILARRGIDSDKIVHISNGADVGAIKPGPKLNGVRKQLGLEGKFVVLYCGTHGASQGLQTLLEAAKMLKIREEIVFVLIGQGVEKESLKEQAARDKLDNVLFLDPVPKSEIADYILASDLCVVLLKKLELFLGAMPSKLYEFMAAEKPVILGIDGEARRMLERAQAGIHFEPENSSELAQAILRMKSDPELMNRCGKNGRMEAERNFSHDVLAFKYEQVLYNVLEGTGRKWLRG